MNCVNERLTEDIIGIWLNRVSEVMISICHNNCATNVLLVLIVVAMLK